MLAQSAPFPQEERVPIYFVPCFFLPFSLSPISRDVRCLQTHSISKDGTRRPVTHVCPVSHRTRPHNLHPPARSFGLSDAWVIALRSLMWLALHHSQRRDAFRIRAIAFFCDSPHQSTAPSIRIPPGRNHIEYAHQPRAPSQSVYLHRSPQSASDIRQCPKRGSRC